MLKNYLKISWRNMVRQKMYSTIINQKMAKELGGNLLNKRIANYAGVWTVIGVVEDFHF